ncbi:uncharacterized protein N7443_003425 [Penicillium atrosanguineum]|nr:uncharacterized protein N7443_003425 [Penicillium atrosanguineum]KAJ5303765.1 hypothetical protein N7443_003425 [Penicillium atrosanguineum]
MSSQPFLPLSSPPASPRLQPRRPSLDPEREILSTRGQQRILTFLPSRTSSTALRDLNDEISSPPTFFRRGSLLIGHSNPRYEWQRYYRPPESLKKLRRSVRQYYERNNSLISQYLYIDRLLDSSLPHNLIEDYNECRHFDASGNHIHQSPPDSPPESTEQPDSKATRIKRTPHNLYRIPDETAPLLQSSSELEATHPMPDFESHGGMSP